MIAKIPQAASGRILRTGPFTVHVETTVGPLVDEIDRLYEAYPGASTHEFADFHVAVTLPASRRWYRPQVRFTADGYEPFRPLPIEQAMPMFEWGLNWCISNHSSRFLIIHAATIEKRGRAVIMPGVPGAGKSTLTAGLVNRGWRLLSDELALISLDDGMLHALARPISLKNKSIEVIRDYVSDAVMSRIAHNTTKGDVALLRAPADSIARIDEPAPPGWIIFPKFMYGLPATLERRPKGLALIQMARNSFNYSVHGAEGFTTLADIVDACGCYSFSYADLDEAVEIFDRLEPEA